MRQVFDLRKPEDCLNYILYVEKSFSHGLFSDNKFTFMNEQTGEELEARELSESQLMYEAQLMAQKMRCFRVEQ